MSEEQNTLPEGFTPIDYIICDSTGLFKTDIYGGDDIGMYVEAQATAAGDGVAMGWGGKDDTSTALAPRITYSSTNSNGYRWNNTWVKFSQTGSGSRYISTLNLLNDRQARLSKADNTLIGSATNLAATLESSPNLIYIGGFNETYQPGTKFKRKNISCKNI